MGCKEDLEAYLRDQKVAFETQHHPRAFTAQEVAAVEHVPGQIVVKTVMAFADDRLVMLALPAPYRVDFVKAAQALSVKEVRLAREAEFAAAFPDCDVGAMPPFGNLYQLPVYVDQALAEDENIICQAGTHEDTISLSYANYARLVAPTVADLAQRPPPRPGPAF